MDCIFPDAETITECCINKFNSLPKTGKPNEKEWTVLSCILQYKFPVKV